MKQCQRDGSMAPVLHFCPFSGHDRRDAKVHFTLSDGAEEVADFLIIDLSHEHKISTDPQRT
ncbi:hypothetical protein E5D57_002077 [Metarhizium anisopliae]|nr:hypothetical protein E5D57_002077 [Metarhizium anisopliae]